MEQRALDHRLCSHRHRRRQQRSGSISKIRYGHRRASRIIRGGRQKQHGSVRGTHWRRRAHGRRRAPRPRLFTWPR
uniref:Uncharacterized protein n=1 Tax=Arundo donax TaxID=35708 RepID=A0A0A9AIB0_ARUDO